MRCGDLAEPTMLPFWENNDSIEDKPAGEASSRRALIDLTKS